MNEHLESLQERYGKAAPDQDAWDEKLDELIAQRYTVHNLLEACDDILRPILGKTNAIESRMETWATEQASENAKIYKQTGGRDI